GSSPLAVGADGTPYFGGLSSLYSFDQDPQATTRARFIDPLAVGNGLYFEPVISPANGDILALAANTVFDTTPSGQAAWSAAIDSPSYVGKPAIDANGTVYVVSGGALVAFNPDGTIRWTIGADVPLDRDPIASPDAHVYAVGQNRLFAFRENG